ncbi:MAG: ABC-2 family transporter protein [Caulobacteraceae bacterium]
MQATLSFWTVESLEVANVLTYGGEAAAEYPLNVYAGWFRDFLVFAVPIGCVTYLPMLAAMGRADPLGSPSWIGPLAPLAGFLFLGLALSPGVLEFGGTPRPALSSAGGSTAA